MEDIVSALLENSDNNTAMLPSVDGVIAVAQDLRELIFPGYRRMRNVNTLHHGREQSAILQRLQTRLRLEIGRALTHVRQSAPRLHHPDDGRTSDRTPAELTTEFLSTLPMLRQILKTDVQAAFNGDPAASTADEILLCYPGIEAVLVHRLAHQLYRLKVPYLPRILSEWAHRETGIDIHPGAKIGERFFIDHGTGVVIGETCEIGSGVTLYQGVTLGAWSFPRDEQGNLIRGTKRHPTLENDVTVFSNASILGGTTVIGSGSRVGSGVTLSRSVPANTIVTIEKPQLRFREAA
ncbi:MAG: serine O-acetyltransferase EpsC [Planctomycetaceae bacterium]